MPALKLITEVTNGVTRVYISLPHHPLSQEIISQLQNQSKTTLVSELPADVIIHLVGFGGPSLSDTLSSTTVLHHLLQHAHKYHSKFILILPPSSSPVHKAAMTLVAQFAKSYSLNYAILEVDHRSNYRIIAEAAIRQFIYHYSAPKISTTSSVTLDSSIPIRPVSRKNDSRRPWWKWVLISMVSVFILFIFQLSFYYLSFTCALTSYLSNNYSLSRTCTTIGIKLSQLQIPQANTLPVLAQLYQQIGLPPLAINQFLISFQDSQNRLNLFYQSAPKYLSQKDISGFSYYLSSTNESLAYLQSELKNVYLSTSYPHSRLESLAQSLEGSRSFLSQTMQLSPEIFSFLSDPAPRRVAVVVQDNTEIRPNGGVITAVVLVTLTQGKYSDVQIISADALDSQLKGAVEPPSDLKKFQNVSQWNLRDAAWSPDFSVSARQIAWFIKKELSLDVDLVIGTNLSLFQQLSSQPNFYQNYQKQITPGNDGKIISQLITQEFSETKRLISQNSLRLWQLLISSLQHRQLFVVSTSNLLPGLTHIDWSGGVSQPLCVQSKCVSDYIYVVDSNLSNNKVDHLVSRSRNLETQFSANQSVTNLTLSYKHTGTASWPQGIYKDYLRVYLPNSVNINSLILNHQPLDNSRYQIDSQLGLKVVSLLFEVSPSSETQISINYTNPLPLSVQKYRLFIPNQPGVLATNWAIKFQYPAHWSVVVSSTPEFASAGQLRYNTAIVSPQSYDLDFTYSN